MSNNNAPSPQSFEEPTLPPRQEGLSAASAVDEFATVIPLNKDPDATLAPPVDSDAHWLP